MRRWSKLARAAGAGLLANLALAGSGGRPAGAADCRVVADFAKNAIGQFPEDWKPREERARDIYKVLEEGGVRFVRATAEGTGLQIGKEFDWDLKAHPVLAWKWRPQVFPTGADERESGKNDSVLGVYAVFPHTPVTVKAVKYVWSLAAPARATASASKGLTRMLVLRAGAPKGAGWVGEAVNVAADYERLFGEAPKQPRGIALLTDADDTKSRAVGDYGAFRICPAGTAASAALEASPRG
ncbi:MAG TPA: DUF3047 domain-containing protein [Methylomirabilota bacterium]|jgi:hypothetical protein|nr:DUF3047 domain-containing protein [Methylomirabilota bacterium]